MDTESLDNFLSVFFWALSTYLIWSLKAGRVHVPVSRPGQGSAIVRHATPVVFWVVWGVYLLVLVYVAVKAFPYGF